jgi:multidrug efflux system membrane fusion protein
VVPAHSIVTTQQGSYVYVVKANNTVEQRTVVPNRTIDNDTVVDKGLQPGEVIVLDGQVNLVPGAKIGAKNGGPQPMAEPAGRPSEAAGSAAQKGAAADLPQGDPNRPKSQ